MNKEGPKLCLGAFQRFEDPAPKFGTFLGIVFADTVTRDRAIRLTDELGTDGVRFRREGQATNFNEIDLFGTPVPALGIVLTIR